MTTPTFAAARMTERMVNRQQELEILHQAMCQPGQETRVIIIKGKGGLGKTRLLSEALWLAGHPHIFPHRSRPSLAEKWDVEGRVIVSSLLDFSEVRLHTFNHFLEALRRAWDKQVEFSTYDAAVNQFKRYVKDLADYFTIQQAAERARKAFFDNYKEITGQYRLVWALDTTEQLTFEATPWLLRAGLLTPDDLTFSTQHQIKQLLREGQLPNTTLILVGRPEADVFFKELITLSKLPASKFKINQIELEPFTVEDVQSYLAGLAQDYLDLGRDDEVGPILEDITTDIDRMKVLYVYTGGQPVRLALFVDTIVEAGYEPKVLKVSSEQAKRRVKWNDEKKKAGNLKALKKVQFEFEAAFINSIFAKTADLRSQILLALARARRGLDIDRLEFVLSDVPADQVDTWRGDAELRRRLEELLDPATPDSLWRLSFVKRRADNRLILQDELYHIYDEHLANDPISRQDEAIERRKLYQRLQAFAEREIRHLREKQRQFREEDERSLHWESPARASSMKFRSLSEDEEQERIDLAEQVLEAQAEQLHYQLRVDPDAGFNNAFKDLANQIWRAGDTEGDALIQAELWQFLNYELARQFIDLPPRKSQIAGNSAWDTLERAAQQDEITRWIKRFILRGDARRAVEFADKVNQFVAGLPEDDSLRITLEHTFSRAERICWQEFARINLAENIGQSISGLEEAAGQMERLLIEGIPERSEFGFRDHPAEVRLQRVIGVTYNNLGIGYTSQGRYREASQAYTKALRYLRGTGFLVQQAVTRNNLSRVLAEIGLITRAIRICQDGLELRKKVESEKSIAFSYNTLALIYNHVRQPENAWPEAVRAVLYFRRLSDQRGLGMSLLQLGTALRRLAQSSRPQPDTPAELFDAALTILSEAHEIFNRGREPIRQVEAARELGCLYRDYMYHLKDDMEAVRRGRVEQYQKRAVDFLNRSTELAREKKFLQLELDALDDLIWTYFYADDSAAVEKLIERALEVIPTDNQLRKNALPLRPDQVEPHYFLVLGKVWAVRGHLRMRQFKVLGDSHIAKSPDKRTGQLAARHDPEAIAALKAAAEAFVLALSYNRLYSIRSATIALTLDILYDYLKTLSVIAMEDFFKYQQQVHEEYRLAELRPEDLTTMDSFLKQSFGDYLGLMIGQEGEE